MADELPLTTESLDDVPEAYRPLYVAHEDGGFHLSVTGAVPKTRMDEFRTNNIKLMKQLEALKKHYEPYAEIDLEQYRQLLEEHQANQDKQLIDAGKIDELIAERTERMRGEFQKQLETLQAERDQLTTTLNHRLITAELQQAAVELNIRKEALEDAVLAGERVFRLHDGTVVAVDRMTGNTIYGTDGEPISIKDWLAERQTDKPHWFHPSSGGGAHHSTGAGGARPTKPLAEWSDLEKVQYIGEHGQDAYEALFSGG